MKVIFENFEDQTRRENEPSLEEMRIMQEALFGVPFRLESHSLQADFRLFQTRQTTVTTWMVAMFCRKVSACRKDGFDMS